MSDLSVEYLGDGIWMAQAKIKGRWIIKSYDERPSYKRAKEDFRKEM